MRRWFGAALMCVLALLLASARQTQAQTAHFITAIPVGSGFSTPWGIAVDGSGDVFVADYGTNTVKEVLAGTGTATSGTGACVCGESSLQCYHAESLPRRRP